MSRLLYALVLLFAVCACQTTKTIVNGVDERDANEILVLLDRNGIVAQKIQEKAGSMGAGHAEVLWDIAVPSEDGERAMALLSKNGLPRTIGPNLLDLFTNTGLVPSDIAEKIRYRQGLSDEIANMIRKIDGIVDVEVQLSFPQQNALNPNAKLPPITASVFVKHTGILDNPNSHLISKIRRLVAGAVSGLTYDHVTVIPIKASFAIPVSTVIRIAPQQYTQVFGFTVATTSAGKLQLLIISIIILLVVLIACFSWLFWKISPILKRRGGMNNLFHLTPLPQPTVQAEVKPPSEEKKAELPEKKPIDLP
ncbi:MAG: EscJ/YscJ/HrcJ family type III secretion inner membrane ring protein [Verrucomicrobia bacterium]|nr:EscJ/YscJ/HrcJ family type III secretion inner membrane ring protein [Verrucomicrobiota bacterium]